VLPALAAAILAFPTTLVGAHAGATLAPIDRASLGPGAGVAADLSIHRQFALELSIDASRHQTPSNGAALLAFVGAGLQYRIDLAPVVPYLTASVRYVSLTARGTSGNDWEGALSLGAIVPFGKSWFFGADATYGYGFSSGAFPLTSAYSLRIGWRSGELF